MAAGSVLDDPQVHTDGLYDVLFDRAELVRWRMTDIPWDTIDESEVSEGLLDIVKAMAIAEMTTFTATQRFMESFFDDIDFSQWMSVWFYEETKHPQAMTRWLGHFGVSMTPDEVMAGRQTFPFMSSREGTLGLNVIAEMTASTMYLHSAALVTEPVLSQILRNVGSDEARHASSFYAFTAKALREAANSARARRDVLLVLRLWLQKPALLRHPTNLATDAILSSDDVADSTTAFRARVCETFSHLLETELRSGADVGAELKRLRTGFAQDA